VDGTQKSEQCTAVGLDQIHLKVPLGFGVPAWFRKIKSQSAAGLAFDLRSHQVHPIKAFNGRASGSNSPPQNL
jgi:hypothetical protein